MTPREARESRDDLIDQLRCERERQGLFQEEVMRRGGPTAACQWGINGGRLGPVGPRLTTIITYADALGMELRLVKREERP